jgi:hypothetical protein
MSWEVYRKKRKCKKISMIVTIKVKMTIVEESHCFL